MAVAAAEFDTDYLKKLHPLDWCDDTQLESLIPLFSIQKIKKNKPIIREGENDGLNYYLLEGSVQVMSAGYPVEEISSDSLKACHPLADHHPRKLSVKAKTHVTVAVIERSRLDTLLKNSSTSVTYAEDEIAVEEECDDWIDSLILGNPFLSNFFPQNQLHRLALKAKHDLYKKGLTVIKQGSTCEHIYIVKSGRLRRVQRFPDQRELSSVLSVGAIFGEETILNRPYHDYSVVVEQDSELICIDKTDLKNALPESMVKTLNKDELESRIHHGGQLIDLRQRVEFEQGTLPGSENIPYDYLFLSLKRFVQDKDYILFGNTYEQACLAAQYLSPFGFKLYVLDPDYVKSEIAVLPELQPLPIDASELSELYPKLDRVRQSAEEVVEAAGESQALLSENQQLVEKNKRLQSENDHLLNERERLEKYAEEHQRAIQRVEREKADLQKSISKMEMTVDVLNSGLNKDEKTILQLQEVQASLESEKKALALAEEKAQAEIESLTREVSNAHEKVSELQKRCDGLSVELTQRDRAFEVLNQTSAEYEKNSEKLREENSAVAQNVKLYQEKNQHLESENKRLLESVSSLSEQLQRLHEEVVGKAEEIQGLLASTQDGQQAYSKLKEDNDYLIDKVRALEKEINQLEKQRLDLNAGLEREVNSTKEYRQDMESEKEKLISQLKGLESENKSLEAELEITKAESLARTEDNDNLIGRVRALEEEINQLEQQRLDLSAGLESEANSIKEYRQNMESEKEKFVSQLNGLEGENKRLETELEMMNAESLARVDEYERKLEAVNEVLNETKQKYERLLEELQEKGAAVDEIKAELSQKTASNQALSEQVQALQGSLETLRIDNESSKEELRDANKRHQDSEALLAAEKSELETRISLLEETELSLREKHKQETDLLTGQVAQLQSQKEEQNAESVSLNGRLSALKHELVESEEKNASELNALNRQIETLENQLKGSLQAPAQKEEPEHLYVEIKTLTSTVNDLTEKAAQLGEENKGLQESLRTAEQQLFNEEANTQQVKRLEQEKQQVEAELLHVENELNNVVSAKRESDAKLAELKQGQGLVSSGSGVDDDLAIAIETEKEKARMLEEQVEYISAERDVVRGNCDKLTEENKQLLGRVDKLQNKVQLFEVQVAQQRSEAYLGKKRSKGMAKLVQWLVVVLVLAGLAVAGSIYRDRIPVLKDYFADSKTEVAVVTPLTPADSTRITEQAEVVTKAPKVIAAKRKVHQPDEPVNVAPVTTQQVDSPSVLVTLPNQAQTVRKGAVLRDEMTDGSQGPEMIYIHGGQFNMGLPSSFPHFDERPQRTVSIKPFYLSRHEVTVDEFKNFLEATSSVGGKYAVWGEGNMPVVNVSWQDTQDYAEWLSKQTGFHYRLPSEAEWEYAARAGSNAQYWWGFDGGQGVANCFDCGEGDGERRIVAVNTLSESPFGLFHILGNAAEWVQDCYFDNYQGAPLSQTPWQEPGCRQRVIRGGGYMTPLSQLRVTKREANAPENRLDGVGFRLVRE